MSQPSQEILILATFGWVVKAPANREALERFAQEISGYISLSGDIDEVKWEMSAEPRPN